MSLLLGEVTIMLHSEIKMMNPLFLEIITQYTFILQMPFLSPQERKYSNPRSTDPRMLLWLEKKTHRMPPYVIRQEN